MATNYEKLSSNKAKLDFVVEPEKFAEGLKTAYNKLKGRFNVPGFRRGKAPMKVIENHYGKGAFFESAFDILFSALPRYPAQNSTVCSGVGVVNSQAYPRLLTAL